jgi:uncharacterized protein (DUF58 family)
MLAALALERPELVIVTGPFAVLAVLGLALARRPELEATVDLDRERALEGDQIEAMIALRSSIALRQLDVRLALPPGLTALDGETSLAVALPGAGEHRHALRLRCERWGAYHVGLVSLRVHGPLNVFRYETTLDRRVDLRVYPRPELARSLVRPAETQVFAGNLVARQKGEGIEFADLRQFMPGDRIRRINWRASARRNELWVNEHHTERNADVILFVDSFAEVGSVERTSLDLAVRAAAALSEQYLRHKDRVGLLSFGGALTWLTPGMGAIQLYRLLDALVGTQIVHTYAWRDVDVIPRRILPPKAMVIALTPLLDERVAGALLDLRARGFDLAVIEVSPLPFVEPDDTDIGRLAYRVWKLRRQTLRVRFERVGIPVAVWDDEQPLEGALKEVTTFRRFARAARI